MTICPRRAPMFLLALFSCSVPMWASPAANDADCTIIIHVTGFRNTKGVLGAELFTSSVGWPEEVSKSFRHAHFPIDGDHATARFDHIPAARYGVVVLHDENENEKLDRNLFMVPKEGFGFANNPRVLLVAPPMEKATIPVTCPTTTTEIHLIYK
ncbi:MAG TPA: DUF2141 domain-containing protein [Acidobacteriaceae bacterium]